MVLMTGLAFVLATGVSIFGYLVGIAAALFASFYTYGLAGAFWIHDTYFGYNYGKDRSGWPELKKRPLMFIVNVLTFISGVFICVAGLYVYIRGIVLAYRSGAIPKAFSCPS